jgi:hypothetical protein
MNKSVLFIIQDYRRYDGAQFLVLKVTASDPTSLGDNLIRV